MVQSFCIANCTSFFLSIVGNGVFGSCKTDKGRTKYISLVCLSAVFAQSFCWLSIFSLIKSHKAQIEPSPYQIFWIVRHLSIQHAQACVRVLHCGRVWGVASFKKLAMGFAEGDCFECVRRDDRQTEMLQAKNKVHNTLVMLLFPFEQFSTVRVLQC